MYLFNQHTSQMKKLQGFFPGSVKKRWTIINNNVAINYGVHYLLRSIVAFSADVRKFSSCFCRVLTRSDEMFVFSRTT